MSHWTDPEVEQVAPGVHRLPLPLPLDGLRAVNVYAVETPEGLTLVDGGWAVEASRARLETALGELGRKLGDVTRFLVTHMHRDHYTQAVTVRREVGAHVSLGLAEKPTLDLINGERTGTDATAAQLVRAGAEEVAQEWTRLMGGQRHDLDHWEYPDAWLEGDLTLEVGDRCWDAVHTPGHTRGHYVFADRAAGLLFAGDHVLPTITPSIGFEPVPASMPLGDFLASLAKVRALPDLALLPAHGPVTTSTHARVDELLAHHDERLARCRRAVAGGCATAREVAGVLTWTRHERHFEELDVFNGALACLETMAHLELLVARGELARGEDGVRRYALPPGVA